MTGSKAVDSSSVAAAAALERAKLIAFGVALLQSFANGFYYGYSVYSTRLSTIVGISRADVVLLGVLAQAGLGVFQYPTTLLINRAIKRGYSVDFMDKVMDVWCGFLFCAATFGIGTVLYICETGGRLDYSTTMAVLGLCYWMWGQAAGAAFNSCSTVINFNNTGNIRKRRVQLVMISLAVGFGGVFVVVVYEFGLKLTTSLNSFLFGTGVIYAAIVLARLGWMKRVPTFATATAPSDPPSTSSSSTNPGFVSPGKDDDDVEDTEKQARPAPPVVTTSSNVPQSLAQLFKSDIVWLTCLSTFLGIGASGTILSSLGNIGSQLDSTMDISFGLTIMFLTLQTFGRFLNAVVYGYGEWPFVFAFWQLFCLFGIVAFLARPDHIGAYLAAAMIGMSFGGFHSCFPILTATAFPGNPAVDYPQSIGVTLAISSFGCIVVGQIATAVYKAAQGAGLVTGFFGMFLFFMAVMVVSAFSAIVLGTRIKRNRRRFRVLSNDEAPHLVPSPSALILAPVGEAEEAGEENQKVST